VGSGADQAADSPETTIRLTAERAFNSRLNGGCQVPIAGHAVLDGNRLYMRALVGKPDGSLILRDEIAGPIEQAEQLGITLADRLLAAGADEILAAIRD